MVRGTKLDTGAYLDKLKALSPNDQVQAARRDEDSTARLSHDPTKVYVLENAGVEPVARSQKLQRFDVPMLQHH